MVTANFTEVFLTGAAAALLFAAIMFSVWKRSGRGYLLCWTLAWFAAAVSGFITAGAELWNTPATRSAALLLSAAAAFLQAGYFLSGCYELARRRPMKLRFVHFGSFTLAISACSAAALAYSLEPGAGAFYRLDLYGPSLLIAVSALVSSTLLGPFRAVHGHRISILQLALIAFGLTGLAHSSLLVRGSATGAPTGILQLLVMSVILGVAMIYSVLEDERETSRLAVEEFEHLAYHDPLTGLPNRSLFLDRVIGALARVRRDGGRVAIFFFDLDRFKMINDSLGHGIGDAVLRGVAERLTSVTRQTDTLSRFGGDEFTLLVNNLGSPEDAGRIARKLLDTVNEPIAVEGRELSLSLSVGISIYPEDGTDPGTLIRNADAAMYRAKSEGRARSMFYTASMNVDAVHRLEVETRLRKSVDLDELILHYQPVFSLQSMKIEEAEALVRWQHPSLGLLQPDAFIPAAEDSDLIVTIGDWVWRNAAAQAARWTEQGRSLTISVNVSARQIHQGAFVQQLREGLAYYRLKPEQLQIEVTESVAIEFPDRAIKTFRALKDLGVRIAMDDFGTGHSSLGFLTKFPIDCLKLDRSFLSPIGSDEKSVNAIISAVVTMAHALDLKVVAEGVETAEQRKFLLDRGCDAIQGFFCSPPLAALDFEKLIGAGPRVIAGVEGPLLPVVNREEIRSASDVPTPVEDLFDDLSMIPSRRKTLEN